MNKINWLSLFLFIALAIVFTLNLANDPEPEPEPNECEYSIFDELKQEWVPCDGYWGWRDAQEWNEIVRKWPRVIVDPDFEYVGEHIKERATADGLTAWGLCMAGNNPPGGFGTAMIKVSKIIGALATPENLMKVEFAEPDEVAE